jgi:hypothetical protein
MVNCKHIIDKHHPGSCVLHIGRIDQTKITPFHFAPRDTDVNGERFTLLPLVGLSRIRSPTRWSGECESDSDIACRELRKPSAKKVIVNCLRNVWRACTRIDLHLSTIAENRVALSGQPRPLSSAVCHDLLNVDQTTHFPDCNNHWHDEQYRHESHFDRGDTTHAEAFFLKEHRHTLLVPTNRWRSQHLGIALGLLQRVEKRQTGQTAQPTLEHAPIPVQALPEK